MQIYLLLYLKPNNILYICQDNNVMMDKIDRKIRIDMIAGSYNSDYRINMSDFDSIVRKLKIDIICGDYNPIIDWFDDLWFDMEIINDISKNNVYYVHNINGNYKWFFYNDLTFGSSRFGCNSKDFFIKFQQRFGLPVDIVCPITAFLLNQKLDKDDINVFESTLDLHLSDVINQRFKQQ